ncbi:MAG: hypothetical protein U0841_30460 [Chloroflexia bacterium]
MFDRLLLAEFRPVAIVGKIVTEVGERVRAVAAACAVGDERLQASFLPL